MNLIRLIALAALFWLLYRVILALLNKAKPQTPRRRTPPEQGDNMVRCEQCGLHIPQAEALTRDGKYYCCEAHRDAGASGQE